MNDYSTRRTAVIDPVADERWDRFVEGHPFGWICHLSVWGEILEESFKHLKGYYLVLLDDNEIAAALPLFEVKSWITGKRLVSIPFATLCDPLISSAEDMKILFESAVELSNRLGSSYMEIGTFLSSQLIRDTRLEMSHHYKHHYLPLDDEPERLKRSFHRTCVRTRIEKAQRSNLRLRVGENSADLKSFYQLFLMTRKRVGLPPHPYAFIKTLWEKLSPSGKISVLLAEHDDSTVAGMILFMYKDRVSVEYAVSDKDYRHLCPNHFLFWEAIQSAYCKGFKVFDFGRTSQYNRGLMDFKGRWGTTVVDLPFIYHPAETCGKLGTLENSVKFRIVRKTCKIAPQPVLNMLGEFIYNHMG